MKFVCPHCDQRIETQNEFAGQVIECPTCSEKIAIPSGGYDVFISHSSKDKLAADAACAVLERSGLSCWVAPRDITPGVEWGEAIMHGIESCRVMVIVFSQHANDSPQVRREVERAVAKGLTIIPVRIEDVLPSKALEYFFSASHWLDAFPMLLQTHLEKLAATILGHLGRAPQPGRPLATPDVAVPRAQFSEGRKYTLIGVTMTVALLFIGGLFFWLTNRGKAEWTADASQAPVSTPAAVVTPTADTVAGPSNPKLATKGNPFENSLGMKFVPVPETNVLFSIWLTRVRDWVEFEQANPNNRKPSSALEHVLGREYPMKFMTLSEAKAFCTWLTKEEKKQGKISSQQEYRLPTDAEWSIAVGLPDEKGNSPYEKGSLSTNKNMYPWGTSWPPPIGAVGIATSLKMNGGRDALPVGSFLPNEFGLYDMGGNLLQWCEDNLGEPGKENFRVQRGSHFNTIIPELLASSYRTAAEANHRGSGADGFRCVLTVSPSPEKVTAPIASASPSTPDPKQATKENPFINSLGMKFVPLPITGGPTDSKLSGKRVLFCIHETRRRDYAVFAAPNSGGNLTWTYPQNGGDDHPVAAVSWEESKEFCDWLSQKEGRNYRLPLDHEWSCAIGIGELEDVNASQASKNNSEKTKGIYPWGTVWPPPRGAGNYHQSLGVDDFTTSAPVMQFAPNNLGIYDLGGNVSEYCEDVKSGSPAAMQYPYLARGGQFSSSPDLVRSLLSSSRVGCPPGNHNGSLGFRCVIVIEEGISTNTNGPNTPDSK